MKQSLRSLRGHVVLILRWKVGPGHATGSSSLDLQDRDCTRLINKVVSFPFLFWNFLFFSFHNYCRCHLTPCPPCGRMRVHLDTWKLLLQRLRLALFCFRLTAAVAQQIRLHKQTLHTKDDVRQKRDKPKTPVYFIQEGVSRKPLDANERPKKFKMMMIIKNSGLLNLL